MTETELELMLEAALQDDWEEQTRPPEWTETVEKLKKAKNLLDEAVDILKEAQGEVSGTPEEFRIGSLADETGWLAGDIQKQIKRM